MFRKSSLKPSISIHALRGEGDRIKVLSASLAPLFQSTPSVGRATVAVGSAQRIDPISIHALRGEDDTAL